MNFFFFFLDHLQWIRNQMGSISILLGKNENTVFRSLVTSYNVYIDKTETSLLNVSGKIQDMLAIDFLKFYFWQISKKIIMHIKIAFHGY